MVNFVYTVKTNITAFGISGLLAIDDFILKPTAAEPKPLTNINAISSFGIE
jgi:hypothetical protein